MQFKSTIILFSCIINYCDSIKYHNYTMFEAIPDTYSKLIFLSELEDLYNAIYWSYPGSINKSIHFVIEPEKKNDFMQEAMKQNIKVNTRLNNVQRAFDNQRIVPYIRRNTKTYNWRNYYRFIDIYYWLNDMKELFSDVLEIWSIGKSMQNRDIMMARIILPNKNEGSRPKVIIEGGIHGREWISVSFVTYFLNEILKAANSTNKEHKMIASMYEWYFVPILNPDGYEYSRKTDRMWRNNWRSVDLNRNFNYYFKLTSMGRYTYRDDYPGLHAFSENETIAMRNFVKSHRDNLRFYLSFHSYGQFIIIPYRGNQRPRGNYHEVYQRAVGTSKRIAIRYKTLYKAGLAIHTVGYYTSGTSTDWVKSNFAVPYVATFILRDTGKYGFALPHKLIMETCEETMDGMWYFFSPIQDVMRTNFILNANFNKASFVFFYFYEQTYFLISLLTNMFFITR